MVIYALTENGKKKCELYIIEMRAKRKEIMDAKKDTCDDTNIDYTPEDLLDDVTSFGVDDDGEAFNGYGVTDHYDMDYPLNLKLGVDFVEAESEE